LGPGNQTKIISFNEQNEIEKLTNGITAVSGRE
jgi:hypothetical protein